MEWVGRGCGEGTMASLLGNDISGTYRTTQVEAQLEPAMDGRVNALVLRNHGEAGGGDDEAGGGRTRNKTSLNQGNVVDGDHRTLNTRNSEGYLHLFFFVHGAIYTYRYISKNI